VRTGVVKAVAALSLAGCSGQEFSLTADQLAAAEQKAFDRVMRRQPTADVLFIAHEWRAGRCRPSGWKRAACVTEARVSPQSPWVRVTARLRKEADGNWELLGADWPRR
jgi:ketosteroid isomerase-like protein